MKWKCACGDIFRKCPTSNLDCLFLHRACSACVGMCSQLMLMPQSQCLFAFYFWIHAFFLTYIRYLCVELNCCLLLILCFCPTHTTFYPLILAVQTTKTAALCLKIRNSKSNILQNSNRAKLCIRIPPLVDATNRCKQRNETTKEKCAHIFRMFVHDYYYLKWTKEKCF